MNFIVWLIIFVKLLSGSLYYLDSSQDMSSDKKLGLIFLALTPVIDLILLITTAVDLMNGATAETPHAILCCLYIRFNCLW